MSRDRFLKGLISAFCIGVIGFSYAPWYIYEAQGNFDASMTISGFTPGMGQWAIGFAIICIVSLWVEKFEGLSPVFAILSTISCVYALAYTPDVSVNVDMGELGQQTASWSTGWGLIAAIVSGVLASAVSSLRAIATGGIVSTDQSSRSISGEFDPDKKEKKCPKCAEYVKLKAKVCKHCGHEWSEDEVEDEVREAREEWREKYEYGGSQSHQTNARFGLSTPIDEYHDIGLLLLRVTVGCLLAFLHGWGKIAGGPEQWAGLGGVMGGIFGIGFLPTFWGFMAAFAEFFAALSVVAGFLTRPAAILVVLNMFVASMSHITGVIDGGPEKAALFGLVFLSLIFTGPGKYSIDEMMGG